MKGDERADVAIIGGGPAGMQAALVLARTRKKVVVFDDPQPPRNAASHGVHNFLGLEGLLPDEIRNICWEQIERYKSAELRMWAPPEQQSPLVQNLVDHLGLELGEGGHVAANDMQQTNVDRVWAAGDVQGWTGGIESAYAGGMAAFPIVHGWYGKPRA